MKKVQRELALRCIMMALDKRTLPKKDESESAFAHRLFGIGSGILSEIIMEAADAEDPDGDDGQPVYTEEDDQSEEFEPEETLTEEARVVYYIDEDGKEDWYNPTTPSVRLMPLHGCPHCQKTCTESEVDAVFGFRNMKHTTSEGEVTVTRRQSWCRDCRKEALLSKQAAEAHRIAEDTTVRAEVKREYGIPAGMSSEEFLKLLRTVLKGRTPIEVWLKNESALKKFGAVTWSKTGQKPD